MTYTLATTYLSRSKQITQTPAILIVGNINGKWATGMLIRHAVGVCLYEIKLLMCISYWIIVMEFSCLQIGIIYLKGRSTVWDMQTGGQNECTEFDNTLSRGKGKMYKSASIIKQLWTPECITSPDCDFSRSDTIQGHI